MSAPIVLGDPDAVDTASLPCAWAPGEGSVEPTNEVAAAIGRAAGALAALGTLVTEQRPPGLERCEEIYAAYRAADGLALHRELVAGREDLLSETMQTWFERVDAATVADFQQIAAERDRVRAAVLEFMESWPILVLPVATGPAFELGIGRLRRAVSAGHAVQGDQPARPAVMLAAGGDVGRGTAALGADRRSPLPRSRGCGSSARAGGRARWLSFACEAKAVSGR